MIHNPLTQCYPNRSSFCRIASAHQNHLSWKSTCRETHFLYRFLWPLNCHSISRTIHLPLKKLGKEAYSYPSRHHHQQRMIFVAPLGQVLAEALVPTDHGGYWLTPGFSRVEYSPYPLIRKLIEVPGRSVAPKRPQKIKLDMIYRLPMSGRISWKIT